jgi:hypothetical protein
LRRGIHESPFALGLPGFDIPSKRGKILTEFRRRLF